MKYSKIDCYGCKFLETYKEIDLYFCTKIDQVILRDKYIKDILLPKNANELKMNIN